MVDVKKHKNKVEVKLTNLLCPYILEQGTRFKNVANIRKQTLNIMDQVIFYISAMRLLIWQELYHYLEY